MLTKKRLLLKMLVVFHRAPRTTPTETMLHKQFIEQIAPLYLVGERCRAVAVFQGVRGLHRHPAVRTPAIVGVVQRIDIHRHASGMGRELPRPFTVR